jgi:hypothetical protein
MDLSDLRIFSAVVRHGGVTRAAERLHRVQSTAQERFRHPDQASAAPKKTDAVTRRIELRAELVGPQRIFRRRLRSLCREVG